VADDITDTVNDTATSENPDWLIPLPPVDSQAQPASPEATPDTAGVTALKSAATGVIPAGGAAAGAEAGAAAGAFVPVLGETGISELAGGFIGAIAGSIAASKAQSAVLNKVAPDFQKQLAIDEQVHPIASAIGDIASSAPAFRFNPGQTVDGVVAAWRAARGIPLGKSEAEIDAAKKAMYALAAQSGMATAGSIVTPLIQGQEPDIKDVGINVLTALTFGEPRFKDVFKSLGLPKPPAKEQEDESAGGAEGTPPPPAPPAEPKGYTPGAAPGAVAENPRKLYDIPEAQQNELLRVAQKEVNEGTDSLDAEDWTTLQSTTDIGHPDYHPEANVFYLKAKAAAEQQKARDAATQMAKPGTTDALIQEGVINASTIKSNAAGGGDSGTPPGETVQEEPGTVADDAQAAARVRGNSGEGTTAARTEPPTGPPAEAREVGNEPAQPKDEGPVKDDAYDFNNTKNLSTRGVEDGLAQGLKPEDVPALQNQYQAIRELLKAAMARKDKNEAQRLTGKGIYVSGLIEAANKRGANYDLYAMRQLANKKAAEEQATQTAPKPEAAQQPALESVIADIDTRGIQSNQQTGRTGKRGGKATAPGFREFGENDDPKEVADSVYDDAVNPNNKGSRLETPKVAFLKKGDEVMARTAYTNSSGGKSVRYLSGERYDKVIADGWKPVGVIKKLSTTKNLRATYKSDRWDEAAALLRTQKGADQRTAEAGAATHQASKEFGRELTEAEVPSSEAKQHVQKSGEQWEGADRLEHFEPDHADAIFDAIHGNVETPEDVLDALKSGGLTLEFEAALRDAGILEKCKTQRDIARAVAMMAEKIYDTYTASGENKQVFQEQLSKTILDESSKSSAKPESKPVPERLKVGDSQNPQPAAAGNTGGGAVESGSKGPETQPIVQPISPAAARGIERGSGTPEPEPERVVSQADRDKVAKAYVEKVRISPTRAAEVFRQTIMSLRGLGVDVRLLNAAASEMAKDTAKYVEWKNIKGEIGRSVLLSMSDVNHPTTDNLVALLHEAAHAVFARETPERQAILHEAISRATNQTLDLGNFFETTTGKFKSEEERVRIAQEGRLAEATARRLVESGFNPAEARSVVQRMAEAIRNLYQRAAMAIQHAMGLPVSPERAMAYFQSRMKLALTGGKADSVVSFLGGPRMEMTEWNHPDALESKDANYIESIRNRNLRGTSDQLETAVSKDIANPTLEKEPGVAAQNIVHGVLHAAVTAFNEEGHNAAGMPANDLIKRFGLPPDLYGPNETPATKIKAANDNLIRNEKAPVNPNLNIADIKNEAVQKQAAALGVGALKSLRENWAAKRRDTERAQARLTRELKGLTEPLNKAITDYTDIDMIAAQAKVRMKEVIDEERDAQKNIPELSGRQSMLDQVMRQIDTDIKGNQMDARYAGALDKLYRRLSGSGDREFSDMLQNLAEHDLNWDAPTSQLKEQIQLLNEPALQPLKENTHEGRALMAAAITFAKKNAFLINLLKLRRSKAMDERVLVNKALQAAVLKGESSALEARRLLEKVTTLKPLLANLLKNIANMKERSHELIDDIQRGRLFMEFHNLAEPVITQALRPLEAKIGAMNVNVNISPVTENVPVPQTPTARPEAFVRKSINLTGPNGQITLKPEIRSDLKKMADWLTANRANRDNLGAEYNEVEAFRDKLSNHLTFFGAAEPIKQLWIARWLAPTAEKLRLVGSPLCKSVAYMVENANTLYRKYRNDEQKHSREWELRRQSAMKALGITNQADFRQSVTDAFKDYVSKNRDIRAQFDRNQDATEASVRAGMEHLRADPATAKLLADPKAAKAVEDFFRKTIEVNKFLADTGKAMGNKVYDPNLKVYRDVIGSEAYEFARGVSKRAKQMFDGMAPWNQMMKGVGKLYNLKDEEALTNILKPRFTKAVASGFVRWICYKDGVSSFGSPKTKDGLQDYARRDNVIKAFENARDKNGDFNPISFAQDLFTFEGGHDKGADLSEFVDDTMHTFDAQYNLLKTMAGDPAENNNDRSMPTPRRYIMDARITDAAPREFYDYIDTDRATLGNLLRSQAYNSAFGRRMENYYQTIAAAEAEQSKYAQQYDNLAATIPDKTGKALRKATLEKAAKLLDENGKSYNVAALREAHANERTVRSAHEAIQGFLSQNQDRPPELNVLAQLMSGIGSLTVSGPGTAFIAHTVAFEQAIRQFGLNADGIAMMKDTATGSASAAMRGFLHVLGREFGINAEHLSALERNGLSNPNTLMRWQDQLRQVFVRPDYVHNVLGRGAIYAGRSMQLVASRLSAFHYLARVIQLGNSVAWANKMTAVIQHGLDHFEDHPEDVNNPDFEFTAKQLGVTQGRAYDYLQFAMGKYGLDLREMIQDAQRRRAEDKGAPLLTDAIYRRIAQVSLDDFTMESSPTTRPAYLVNNSLGQLSNPMLGWTLQKTYVVARAMRNANGQRSFNGYKTAAIAYAAILPMAMMAAYIRNKFDEDVQGKKQNVSDLSTINNAQQAFLTALDNAARVGTFGIAGEFANYAANQDNARPMSLDGRLFFLNTLENVGSSISNLIHQRDFDYQTVVRPMLQAIGGNGFFQYAGILNHTLSLDNAEARVNNRISVNNYLRVAGRINNLDVRTYEGMMNTASQATPWRSSIGQMVMAAYANDSKGFMAAREEAVQRLIAAGYKPEEAQLKVIQFYQDSNPLRVVFRTLQTQADYQKMLASMDSNGREATATAMRLYAHYGSEIGAKDNLFASGVKRQPAGEGSKATAAAMDPTVQGMLNRLQLTPPSSIGLTDLRQLITR
jgi:hypothetical protein